MWWGEFKARKGMDFQKMAMGEGDGEDKVGSRRVTVEIGLRVTVVSFEDEVGLRLGRGFGWLEASRSLSDPEKTKEKVGVRSGEDERESGGAGRW